MNVCALFKLHVQAHMPHFKARKQSNESAPDVSVSASCPAKAGGITAY